MKSTCNDNQNKAGDITSLIIVLRTDEVTPALELARVKRSEGVSYLLLCLTDHLYELVKRANEPSAMFLDALHGEELMELAEQTISFVKEWPKRLFHGEEFRKRFMFDGLHLWWFAEQAFYRNIVDPVFVYEGFKRFLKNRTVTTVILFGSNSLKHQAILAIAGQHRLPCQILSPQQRPAKAAHSPSLRHRFLKLAGVYHHLRASLRQRPPHGGLLFFSHQRFGFAQKTSKQQQADYLLDHRFAGFFDRLLEEGQERIAMIGCETPEVAGKTPSASLKAIIDNGHYPFTPLTAYYRPEVLRKTKACRTYLEEFWHAVANDAAIRQSLCYEGSHDLGQLFLQGLKQAIFGTLNQYRYYLLVDKALQCRQPEVVLLAQPDIALFAACRKRQIPSLFIQHGVVTDFAKLSDIPAVTYLPFYLEDPVEVEADAPHLYPAPSTFAVWGEGVRDFFLRHGYPRKRLKVTGYPGNDLFTQDNLAETRQELSRQGVDFTRKIVTFFTTYYTRNPDRPFSCFYVGDSALVERFETVIRAVRDYLQTTPTPLQLVVKLHPCDDNLAPYQTIAARYELDVVFLRAIEANAIIACSDLCISPVSSVIVSIALAGKPLLVVDDTELPQDTFYQRATFASFSFNKTGLAEAVSHKLQELQSPCDNDALIREFVRTTIGDQNTSAYDRLRDVIKQIRQTHREIMD